MQGSIAVLAGDGVGPEVVGAALSVLERVGARFGHSFQCTQALIGGCAIDATGDPLPPATLDLALRSDAVLLGAVGGPKWSDPLAPVRPEQGLLGIRQALGLYANLRPVTVSAGLESASTLRPEVIRGVDMVIVRELTGGLYFGKPQERRVTPAGREAVDTLFYTEQEIARLMRVAFQLARQRSRPGRQPRVTSVDKANVLASSRLWREVAHEVARDYPDVLLEDQLVDSCAMALVRRPADFDVIATENTFGDILSDEASMLAGSMGMLPSASLAGFRGATSGAVPGGGRRPRRHLRAHPRLRAGHRRQGPGQPPGRHPHRRADAGTGLRPEGRGGGGPRRRRSHPGRGPADGGYHAAGHARRGHPRHGRGRGGAGGQGIGIGARVATKAQSHEGARRFARGRTQTPRRDADALSQPKATVFHGSVLFRLSVAPEPLRAALCLPVLPGLAGGVLVS